MSAASLCCLRKDLFQLDELGFIADRVVVYLSKDTAPSNWSSSSGVASFARDSMMLVLVMIGEETERMRR